MSEIQVTADSEPVGARGGWQRFRQFLDRRLRVLFAFACVPTVLSFFGRFHWTFDNLTSFVVQYAIAGFVFLVAFLCVRRPGWAVAAAIVVGVNLVRFWPAGVPPQGAVGEPLRIVSANVKTSNRQFDRLTHFVRASSPDLLLVIEVDEDWAAALETLKDELPHAVVLPRDDNFGIALFSRVPIDESAVVEWGDSDVPTIVARLRHDGRRLTILGTHPLPPVRAHVANARNRQLAAAAEFVRQESNELVLLGDLNVSPWSPYFRDLLREGRLADSRDAFGIQPTWPAEFLPLRTPIDHLLTTDGLVAVDRSVGPRIGSDHLPIVAEIAFRSTADPPP